MLLQTGVSKQESDERGREQESSPEKHFQEKILESAPDLVSSEEWKESVKMELDNPTYYDPEALFNSKTGEKIKRVLIQEPCTNGAQPAALKKIPALRKWKLDFTASPKKNTSYWHWGRILALSTLIGIMILLLIGIAVIALMAVQTGMNLANTWFGFEEHESKDGSDIVDAYFRIVNKDYTEDLQNYSSTAFRALAAELKHSMDIIFVDSSLMNFYNTTDSFRFRNGSLVVSCRIVLKQKVPSAAHLVGLVFVEALEKRRGILPSGMLYVDVHTIRFEVAKVFVEQPRKMELSNHRAAFWSDWSEWSSCLSERGYCDGSKVRVRARGCRFTVDQEADVSECLLDGEKDTFVQTLPCLCPATLPYMPATWSEWGEWSLCTDITNRCDPRLIQRRSRNCLRVHKDLPQGQQPKLLPTAACSNDASETGVEIRFCSCPFTDLVSELQAQTQTSTPNYSNESVPGNRKSYLFQGNRPHVWLMRSILEKRPPKKFPAENETSCLQDVRDSIQTVDWKNSMRSRKV